MLSYTEYRCTCIGRPRPQIRPLVPLDSSSYCKFGNFREGLISQNFTLRSFVKIKPARNGEITLPSTNADKTCLSRDILTSQICFLTLFAKTKFSRKFPDLQYACTFRASSELCVWEHWILGLAKWGICAGSLEAKLLVYGM